jgi:hypothetical protein
MISRENGVRSRIAQTTSNGFKRATISAGTETWLLNTVMSARSFSGDQSALFSATFW